MTTTTKTKTSHPAKFPKYVLDRIALYVRAEARTLCRPAQVLDPFAGVGRIHDLPDRFATTTGIELEPEWANCRAGTILGDATALPADWTQRFDVLATSPCYGNRIADCHEARDSCAGCDGTGVTISEEGCGDAPWLCSSCQRIDCVCGLLARDLQAHNRRCLVCRGKVCPSCNGNGLSRRYTYRRSLGRMPSDGSAATLQWGNEYRQLHHDAWTEVARVLRPWALALVNVKNHVRDHREQMVAEWHAQCLGDVGFKVVDVVRLPAPGIRHGENREARVEEERIIVARRTP